MFNYRNELYGIGQLSAVVSEDILQPNGYPNYSALEFLRGAEQPCVTQKLKHLNSYPESITSCCSDEVDEQYLPPQAPHRGNKNFSCGFQQPQYCHWDRRTVSDKFMCPRIGPPITDREQSLARDECCYPRLLTLSNGPVPNLGSQLNVHASRRSYDIASRECDMRFQHFRRQGHLLKIEPGDRRTRLKHKDRKGTDGKKKRYRPFAAIRERERLAVMNSALKELKTCLPLDNHEQKLSKKQILVSAAIYIKRLSETLDRQHEPNSKKEEKTVNLDTHDYILDSQ